MKNFSFTVLFFVMGVLLYAQNPSEYVREHAVHINSPQTLNDSVYELLSPFTLIMIGEMHGTQEPPQFTSALAELFSSKGDSVQVGMEIPSQSLKKYLSEKTDSSVYASDFFAKPIDGRQSYSWADVISKLNSNPRVSLFFFDRNDGDGNLEVRDSIMYKKVKQQMLSHPNHKTITLTGNAHNMTESDERRMGYYLKLDRELNPDKICSLNLYFISGTMVNNSGDGLKEKTVNYDENVISKAVPWDYFVMMANPAKNYEYTGILFCRKITASKMVSQ